MCSLQGPLVVSKLLLSWACRSHLSLLNALPFIQRSLHVYIHYWCKKKKLSLHVLAGLLAASLAEFRGFLGVYQPVSLGIFTYSHQKSYFRDSI